MKAFPLQSLLDLSQSRMDDAARKLGQLLASEQEVEKTLALLEQYREEYETRFRQAAQSGIIANAHRINQGQMPEWRPEQSQDFFLFQTDDPERAAELVVEIVQERIPHPMRGILGTGRPWDYSSEDLVTELTFEHEDGEVYSLVFLDNLEAKLLDGSLRTAAQRWAIENPTLDEERLCLALTSLVESAKNLQKLHDIPLDIEFVVTSEWKIVFVQLRPLFRL